MFRQEIHTYSSSSTSSTTTNTTTTYVLTTVKMIKQWLLMLAWSCVLLLHVQHGCPGSVQATHFFPQFRFNKTHLDKVNKMVWMNRFRKALEVAEGESSRASNEISDDNTVKRTAAAVTSPPPVMVTSGVNGGRSDGGGGADRAQFTNLRPLIVFSKATEKNMLEFSIQRPFNSANLPISVSKINLYVYVWKRRESRRLRQNRRRFRKRLIKIRVFQVDERNRKGKRIAELRKNVHSSHWHRLSLPVSLVHSTWQAQNETLRLRVRCKRCTRKVQLIMPTDAVKCNKQRMRRQKLKANVLRASPSPSSSSGAGKAKRRSLDADKKCHLVGRGVPGLLPFMVIENKAGGFASKSDRSKRHAGEGPAQGETRDGSSIPQRMISPTGRIHIGNFSLPGHDKMLTAVPNHRLQRSTKTASVSSPSHSAIGQKTPSASHPDRVTRSVKTTAVSSSLPTVVARILQAAVTGLNHRHRRSAADSSSSAASSPSSSLPGPIRVCNPSPRHSDCCVLAMPVDPAEYGMGESIVAPTTLMATSCEGSCSAPRRRGRRMRGSGRRGGRRKKGRQWSCQPAEQEALEIWYFDHNHELAHASLPGLVISQCACRRQ